MYDYYSRISKHIHTAATMKFLFSALFTILAIIGLGQSHQFPDFGKGPLHEDLQEILDLLPMKRIVRVVRDYMAHDPEVQEAVNFLKTTPVFKNLMIDLENIPEVINLLNYLQEESVESYNLINQINIALGIKELVPPTIPTPTPTSTSTPTPTSSSTPTSTPTPTSSSTPTSTPTPISSSASTPTSSSTPRPTPTSTPSSTPTADLTPEPTPEPTPVSYNVMRRRSWGLAGLFKDVKDLLNYDDFISLYVDKLRYSSAFNDLLNELRSNSQQIVNRLSESESFQIIVTGLKNRNVNLKIVADVLYIVLDVTIPGRPKTFEEECADFVKLLPLEEISDIVLKYVNGDEGVQNAILFMFKPEFHDLLRAVEALPEHQELVVFFQKAGVHFIESIQALHKAIGMEDYVPPKIESFLKSQIKKQEVGGGLTAMIQDIYALLPYEKIDALFEEKVNTSTVFAKFVSQISSPEFENIVNNLVDNEVFLQFIRKSNEQGLDLVGLLTLSNRIIGLK